MLPAMASKAGAGKSFRPTRLSTVALNNPLIITPLGTRNELTKSRFNLDIRQFLESCVELANSAPRTRGTKWNLEYRDDIGERPEYMEISVDPFNFYKTCIHRDDWNLYMKTLETNGSSIRNFITLSEDETYKTLDKILISVGERDIALQSKLSSEELNDLGLDPDQNAQDKADAKVFRARLSHALKAKRKVAVKSFEKRHSFDNGMTRIEVDLSADKMSAATGKRGKEQSQKAVMGNASASDLAKSLGWETKRLKSGCYSSEWLHLSAFSWGGFMPTGNKSGFSTSQNLENLVFGTSETNSLMTRYEMAWQDFFRFEQQISDKLNKMYGKNTETLKGALQIVCNDFSENIRFDMHVADRYYISDCKLDSGWVGLIENIAEENMEKPDPKLLCKILNNDNDKSPRLVQDDRIQDRNLTLAQMLVLAHDFPFVVYSINYSIRGGFHSKILEDSRPGGDFWFYPFHRSLYHEAEGALDSVIWEQLKIATMSAIDRQLQPGDPSRNLSQNLQYTTESPQYVTESLQNWLEEFNKDWQNRSNNVENQDWLDQFEQDWKKRSADIENAKKGRSRQNVLDAVQRRIGERAGWRPQPGPEKERAFQSSHELDNYFSM